jgi:hypothetical protein
MIPRGGCFAAWLPCLEIQRGRVGRSRIQYLDDLGQGIRGGFVRAGMRTIPNSISASRPSQCSLMPSAVQERVVEKNVGSADRLLRIVVGLVLLSLVFVGPQTPWGWIGLVLLGTAAMSWCPLYRVIGINTCKRSS